MALVQNWPSNGDKAYCTARLYRYTPLKVVLRGDANAQKMDARGVARRRRGGIAAARGHGGGAGQHRADRAGGAAGPAGRPAGPGNPGAEGRGPRPGRPGGRPQGRDVVRPQGRQGQPGRPADSVAGGRPAPDRDRRRGFQVRPALDPSVRRGPLFGEPAHRRRRPELGHQLPARALRFRRHRLQELELLALGRLRRLRRRDAGAEPGLHRIRRLEALSACRPRRNSASRRATSAASP